jgi:selenocysteine-specific elongation factor
MLAGVGPVRLVLFVVAADEGWKPQSEEHLEIVDVLGVHGAVIALTKLDLVDREGLARARTDVAERVAGTALENARVVACSSTTGEGLDDLVAALDEMLARAPEPERDRRPRLFVDRVFSIKGTGTVVTGTLSGGPIALGEDVDVLPSGARARIRGLQTHHRHVEVARPVSRWRRACPRPRADRARRGLSHPGAWLATDVLEAHIEPVRSLDRALTSRGRSPHAGAAERRGSASTTSGRFRGTVRSRRSRSPNPWSSMSAIACPARIGDARPSPAASSSTRRRRAARDPNPRAGSTPGFGHRANSSPHSWSSNGGPSGPTISDPSSG